MTTQQDMLTEIARERTMRRHVWNTVPGSNKELFVNLDHQKYYNRLADIQTFIEAITPTEFKTIMDRIERRKAEAESQTALF
jgi:hypothetical protein